MSNPEKTPAGGPAPPAWKGWSWLSLAAPAAISLPFLPILAVHCRLLWARPHYQFFPLVLPAAAVLAARWGRRLGPVEPGSPRLAGAAAAVGWVLLAVSVLFISTTLGAVAALVTLLAGVYALGGPALVKGALPAWVMLWLAVPLPRRLDNQLVAGLQSLVSRLSGRFLDMAHVYHVMEGNVVQVAGDRLLIDQACSGIYSLLTLVLGGLFYGLWVRTSVFRTVVLLAASLFWVIFGNVARIVAIVLLKREWGVDASAGWRHEALGMAIFLLMLGLLASVDGLYSFAAAVGARAWRKAFGFEMPDEKDRPNRLGLDWSNESAAGPRPAPTVAALVASAAGAAAAPVAPDPGPTRIPGPRGTWVGSALAVVGFLLLALPQALMPGVNWKEVLVANDEYSAPFEKLGDTTLPARFQSYQRVGFRGEHRKMDDSWGENSKFWVYRQGYRGASVSVDYQFVDWHDLTLCYTSQGWQITGQQVGGPRAAAESGRPGARELVFIDLVNHQGWYGYLVYGLYGKDGRPVAPPESRGVIQTMAGRVIGWFSPRAKSDAAVARLTHQIQLFIESESPLSPADREQALAFYELARAAIQREGLGVVDRTAAGPEDLK